MQDLVSASHLCSDDGYIDTMPSPDEPASSALQNGMETTVKVEDSTSIADPRDGAPETSDSDTQQRITEMVHSRLFASPPVPMRIGRFLILEPIGQGAMGLVYAAYDDQLDRKVAVKVLLDDRLPGVEERMRFQREAQALARLSHPNVVTVHEVGHSDSRFFLAMEYIRGQSLDTWFSTEPDWPQVLDAFMQAGRGLAAAHDAELVHRDLKPANIIRSDDGTVKVLDFGLVRVLGDEADPSQESTVTASAASALSSSLTRTGTLMGTPAYMAPEQFQGETVDGRSDQYSFCIALWEGLAGQRPFGGSSFKALLAARMEGPPPWPGDAPSVPKTIVEALRRGLSTDPGQRWPSMNALLEALTLDPRRPRSRWLLWLTTAGVLGTAGAVLVAWSEARAKRCSGAQQQMDGIWDDTRRAEVEAAVLGAGRAYASDVWRRTQRELSAYSERWVAMHTNACEATAVRGEQSSRVMDLQMRCLGRAARDLRATVDTLASADSELVSKAHDLLTGLPPLSRCADMDALEFAVEPPLPQDERVVEDARRWLAQARSLRTAGRYEAAAAAVETSATMLDGVAYEPAHAERMTEYGLVLAELGKYQESERALSGALGQAMRTDQRGLAADAARGLLDIAGSKQRRAETAAILRPLLLGLIRNDPVREALSRRTIAEALQAQGKYEEAENELRAVIELQQETLGSDHPEVAKSRHSRATVLVNLGRYEESESEHRAVIVMLREALGPDHPLVARMRGGLARVLAYDGRPAEAEAEFRAVITLLIGSLGPDHPLVAKYRTNLGATLYQQRKLEEAEAEHRTALAIARRALGPDHPDIADSRASLGLVLTSLGRFADAEVELRAALALRTGALGPDHPAVASSRTNLSIALAGQGKYEEAETQSRAALALREKLLGPEHPEVANIRFHLGLIMHSQDRYEEAAVEHRAALTLREKTLDPGHPNITISQNKLAESLLDLGRLDEALSVLEGAHRKTEHQKLTPLETANLEFNLARVLWSIAGPARDRERARALAEDALDTLRGAQAAPGTTIDRIEQWLADHQAH